ncbi:hypothetical protein LTR78_001820 [Recurvomyces mirabilis]|uniref:Glycine zipper 2TM domain-containing protein n=1 Tax=Recurvomyces mirabilis TaxID=574656 RepID=A0AAE0WVC6_9PEZI|nr:hypothetical protein LTR78_001820 [Recurvomyces mirabilis]KAK5156739.1 hypothetical protein LTS14_004952 [Recurvomyces mirabilis]
MAAADYYNPGGGNMPQAPAVQAPRPQQQYPYPPQQSNSTLPYPVSDAPPPYSQFSDHQRPHSQPPPQNRPQPHVNFAPTNNYGPAETHAYPPDKQNHRPSAMHNVVHAQASPGQYGQPQQPPYRPPVPQPQSGYPFPNGLAPPPPTETQRRASGSSGYRPAVTPYQGDYDYDSRSVSRDRGSSGRHHHHHHHDQSTQQKKKGKNSVSTFLGAGGGALIGDLIFPGLGTIGGAVLGGVGGHEYGKQRRSYSNVDGRSKSYHSSRDYDYDEGLDRRGRRRDVY